MPGMFDRIQNDLEQRERMAGISPVDLLDMPDDLRMLLLTLSRKGELSLPALCEHTGLSPDEAAQLLQELEDKGFVLRREIRGEAHYRTYFGQRRRRELPIDIWSSLSELTDSADEPAEAEGDA